MSNYFPITFLRMKRIILKSMSCSFKVILVTNVDRASNIHNAVIGVHEMPRRADDRDQWIRPSLVLFGPVEPIARIEITVPLRHLDVGSQAAGDPVRRVVVVLVKGLLPISRQPEGIDMSGRPVPDV